MTLYHGIMFFDLKLILGQLVVFFFNILEDVSSFNTTKLKKKKKTLFLGSLNLIAKE